MLSCIIQFILLCACSIFTVKFKFSKDFSFHSCLLSTRTVPRYPVKMCWWYLCLDRSICPPHPSTVHCEHCAQQVYWIELSSKLFLIFCCCFNFLLLVYTLDSALSSMSPLTYFSFQAFFPLWILLWVFIVYFAIWFQCTHYDLTEIYIVL